MWALQLPSVLVAGVMWLPPCSPLTSLLPTAGVRAGEVCRAPRSGWALAPRSDGEIGTLYWDLFKHSEAWVAVRPKQNETTRSYELIAVFSICFPARSLTSTPRLVLFRMQINRSFVPAPSPKRSLMLTLNGHTSLELTGPAFAHYLDYPCGMGERCTYDAVVAQVPWDQFEKIAAASEIRGTLLDRRFWFTSEQAASLERFRRHVAR